MSTSQRHNDIIMHGDSLLKISFKYKKCIISGYYAAPRAHFVDIKG